MVEPSNACLPDFGPVVVKDSQAAAEVLTNGGVERNRGGAGTEGAGSRVWRDRTDTAHDRLKGTAHDHRLYRASKAWWKDVARIELTHVGSRGEAEKLELAQIKALNPRHNVVGKVA